MFFKMKESSTTADYPKDYGLLRTAWDWTSEHQVEILHTSIENDLYKAMTTNEIEDAYIHPCKVQFSPTEIALRETWKKSGTTLNFTTWLEKKAIPAIKKLVKQEA